MNLQKPYDRVNREVLWQVLKMYDVGGKPLSGIKSMHVILLRCVGKSLKVNASKSKVMLLNGEEGLECEVYIDGI